MRYFVRTILGTSLFAFGLTCLTYGIAQAIEVGSCGTDEYGRSYGPTCPSGTGAMIAAMVLGSFVAILGTGLLASRGPRPGDEGSASGGLGLGMGIAVGQLAFWGAAIPAAGAAVVFGIVDLHDNDTRPGLEVVAASAGAIVAMLLLMTVLSRGTRGVRRAVRPGQGASLPGIPGSYSAPSMYSGPSPSPVDSPFAPQPQPQQYSPPPFAAPPAGPPPFTPPPGQPFVPSPPVPAAPSNAQLEQLDALRRSGALTETEYLAARARLLEGR